MRVALVTSLLEGGPLEHTLVLSRALARANLDVRVVCASRELAERFRGPGVAAAAIPLRHQLDAVNAVRIRRLLSGSDVVHAQDRRAALWTRALPPRGAAVVQTVHGLPDPYLPPPAGRERPGLLATLAYRGVDAKLAWRAAAVITPSRAVAGVLTDRLGYPGDRLAVVPNGIELGAPPAAPGDAIGTLAALEPVKALDVLVDAAPAVLARHPERRFAVFGAGSQAAALRDRAAARGLADRLAFPGRRPAREALAGLGVFVLCSLYENSPMALLEAMAAGVPAVATRVGGVPEIAVDGTAELVPARDPAALAAAILRLLDEPERARRQALAARRRVEREHGADVMAERTLDVYRHALAGRR